MSNRKSKHYDPKEWKSVIVRIPTWRELWNIKLDKGIGSIDDVITYLMKNQRESE